MENNLSPRKESKMNVSENLKLIGISMLFVIGLSACGKVSGRQPTSGTWTCDNASQNYRPWQEWTFSSDGSLIINLAGFKSSGHYVWESADRLNITFADDPKINQTWYIIKASDDGWLMSNGRFQVACHH